MPMTSDARRALSTTIRSLRARLLEDLHDATETAYRLSLRPRDAGLGEAARSRRGRLESWVSEQVRAQGAGSSQGRTARSKEDFRREAEKRAAYTLLNRLVLLRLMEEKGPSGKPLRSPPVVTGGWESRGYQDFRQLAQGLAQCDETEGYALLLRFVFEDMATDLPGLFGPAGVADLVPVSAATLRHVIDALNDPELDSCWSDDMTLGWVYQYWNDPEREDLDAKLNSGGKLEPHEIASKTQMFTERYMVDWLLQNSLGPMWLAMCRKHDRTAEVEASGTLDALEERRQEWRALRELGPEKGGVGLTELMPLETDAERRWAYYVPQPLPEDAVKQAPESVRDLKILDPAVGSGHFLVVALDLLVALYREEARHRRQADESQWTDQAIVENILSENLHGIDLDPRAVQIAAAALWLKARQVAPEARPERLNLVASDLHLVNLPREDPALLELRAEVERETGIPGELTDKLVHALRGAGHLGSLLRVDREVEAALNRHDEALRRDLAEQGELFVSGTKESGRRAIDREEARATLLDRLERFLGRHTSGDDLGLRLGGEQLAAGVRFVRMVREGTYDLVVANPPYQGTSRMVDPEYVAGTYPLGKADLYAAFLLRGLELVRDGGLSAMLTMRNWMFIKQYAGLREQLLDKFDLRALHDLASGAFEEISAAQVVVSVVSSIFSRGAHTVAATVLRAFDDKNLTEVGETERKRAATLCHVGRHTFDPAALKVVPEWPLVYWWDEVLLRTYARRGTLGGRCPARKGIDTGDNAQLVRRPWELSSLCLVGGHRNVTWAPYVMGSKGLAWIEPLQNLVRWSSSGLLIRVRAECSSGSTIRNPSNFYRLGVAFAPIGSGFCARMHRYAGICDNMGTSVFPDDLGEIVCLLNSSRARSIMQDLAPGVHFQAGDVNRIPLFSIRGAGEIASELCSAFSSHEAHRESSVEFRRPGPSPWRHAQVWAQESVDRPEGAPLPTYVLELDTEPPTDHLSFALGSALGRFGCGGEGILDPEISDLSDALPHGLLFLDTTLGEADHRDGLGHPAAAPLHAAWAEHGPSIGKRRPLREWLAFDFFKDIHKGMYENRPIHWPLSSENRTFVAWVNIHRFDDRTLTVLLADHLAPTLKRLEGELDDLRSARDGVDRKAAGTAEKQFDRVLKARDELRGFVAAVEQCADRGAPPTDGKCPRREQDARYEPDLDDGVLINSAALWPLLDPQWKDPKKWWKLLSTAKGRKDYDWSQLAMRYWPKRVDEKCREDPSLAVAHGCFWRYHPGRAWAWELRLQDGIDEDFRIEEAPYRPDGLKTDDEGDGPHRESWLRDHPDKAVAAIEAEAIRRMGRGKKRNIVREMRILERGFWQDNSVDIWEMEQRLSKKQQAPFRLTAPGEPEARAAYEAAHPDEARERAKFLSGLAPAPSLFDDEEDEEPDDDLDRGEEE